MTSPERRTSLGLTVVLALQACGGLNHYDPGGEEAPVLSELPPPTPVGTTTDTTSTTSTSTTTPWPTTSTTSSTSSTSTTSTTGGTTASVRLRRVEPDYGTNAGGTRITLTGEFDNNTEAYVNGVRATRRSRDATTLVVEAPPSDVAGWVEVMVESGGARASKPTGFQYWQDAAGRTGAAGIVSYQDYVGGYWAGGTPNDDAFGRFAFTEDSDWQLWNDYADTMNSCRYSNNAPRGLDPDMALPVDGAFAELDPQASVVRFVGPYGEVVRLEQDSTTLGTGWYANLQLSRNNTVPGTLYDLEEVNGGLDWPSFGLAGALKVPTSFNVSSPRLDQNNLPDADRSIDLAWSNNTADYMVVWIRREVQGLFGGTYTDGYVTCAMDDTGSFTIPANKWPDWYAGDFLYIKVGRVLERQNTLPHDDSTSRLAGVYWIYGAAITVN